MDNGANRDERRQLPLTNKGLANGWLFLYVGLVLVLLLLRGGAFNRLSLLSHSARIFGFGLRSLPSRRCFLRVGAVGCCRHTATAVAKSAGARKELSAHFNHGISDGKASLVPFPSIPLLIPAFLRGAVCGQRGCQHRRSGLSNRNSRRAQRLALVLVGKGCSTAAPTSH